jgi:hypothetical protein
MLDIYSGPAFGQALGSHQVEVPGLAGGPVFTEVHRVRALLVEIYNGLVFGRALECLQEEVHGLADGHRLEEDKVLTQMDRVLQATVEMHRVLQVVTKIYNGLVFGRALECLQEEVHGLADGHRLEEDKVLAQMCRVLQAVAETYNGLAFGLALECLQEEVHGLADGHRLEEDKVPTQMDRVLQATVEMHRVLQAVTETYNGLAFGLALECLQEEVHGLADGQVFMEEGKVALMTVATLQLNGSVFGQVLVLVLMVSDGPADGLHSVEEKLLLEQLTNCGQVFGHELVSPLLEVHGLAFGLVFMGEGKTAVLMKMILHLNGLVFGREVVPVQTV